MTVSLGIILFTITFVIYLLSTICYLSYTLTVKEHIGKAATALLGVGWIIHTAALVVRTVAAGRPPFLNLYEYVLSLTWGVVLVYLIVEFLIKNRQLGAFAVPSVTIFAYVATRLSSEVNPTMPALVSTWRVPHICTAILAYAAFAIAFGVSIMYLIRERSDKTGVSKKSFWNTRMPSLKTLDQLIYRLLAFGFIMQTALLVTGAIWAQFAWGRYWGWDPKETWALITWLIYAAYLHMRVTRGWQGHKSAMVCLIGFIATIFTLFGVSFLLPGLHSYAG